MTGAVDPITLEVVCEGLISIVREMRASIIRASYSPAIYELDDFSCAMFNAKAEMVAQSDDHPGHVIPMPWSVRCAMEDFEGDIEPGDIIVLNDSYRGGTHLNDVTLLFPVVRGRRARAVSGGPLALGRCRRHDAGELLWARDIDLSGGFADPADQALRTR